MLAEFLASFQGQRNDCITATPRHSRISLNSNNSISPTHSPTRSSQKLQFRCLYSIIG